MTVTAEAASDNFSAFFETEVTITSMSSFNDFSFKSAGFSWPGAWTTRFVSSAKAEACAAKKNMSTDAQQCHRARRLSRQPFDKILTRRSFMLHKGDTAPFMFLRGEPFQ